MRPMTEGLLPVLGVPLLLEPVVRRAVVPAQGAPVEPARWPRGHSLHSMR